MTGLDVDEQVADALAHLGAAGRRVLRRTDKTTAVDAVWSGRRVVVKVLTTTDAYWRQRWHREAQTYAAFATTPPPFAVPMLLHDEDGIRVLNHADAAPLHTDRYPAEPLDRDAVTAAVTALLSVAAWPGGLPAADYHHMLDQTSPQCDRGAVAAALDRIPSPLVTQHGDPLPSNLLLTGERRCVLVDFEHSARFLPGYDLAVLTCLLAGQPDHVRLIVADAAATMDPACFAVNLCLAADRETRIHWAVEPDDERRRRLALLDIVADSATRALRRL